MDAVLGLAEESVLDVANVVEGGLSAGARELMRMVISWRNAPPRELRDIISRPTPHLRPRQQGSEEG